MMKIASHNSWSFAKPANLISRLLRFTAKCQTLNIQQQYDLGIRMFDLRIKPRINRTWTVNHGLVKFKVDVLKDLEWLNNKATLEDPIYIRVVEEFNSECYAQIFYDKAFCEIVEDLSEQFLFLDFVGGYRKYDWKKLCDNLEDISIVERYSSVTSLTETHRNNHKWYAKLDDLYPFLYAKLHNKKLREEYKNSEWLMIDFVEL